MSSSAFQSFHWLVALLWDLLLWSFVLLLLVQSSSGKYILVFLCPDDCSPFYVDTHGLQLSISYFNGLLFYK